MAFTMAMPKLVAIRYRRHSYSYFVSASLVGVLLAALFFLFVSPLILGEWPFFLGALVFLLKASDSISEVNAVFFRRKSKDLRFLPATFIKFTFSLISIYVATAMDFEIGVLLLFVLVGAIVGNALEFYLCPYSLKLFSLRNSIAYYWRLLRAAHGNIYGAMLSVGISVGPRYAAAWLIGPAAAGTYLIASYIYTGVITFGSIVIQAIVARAANFTDAWRNIKRRFILGLVFCYFLLIPFYLVAGEPLMRVLLKEGYSADAYWLALTLILATGIVLSRDLLSYRLMDLRRLRISNIASLGSIFAFWLSIVVIRPESLTPIGAIFSIALLFGMVILQLQLRFLGKVEQ